MKAQRRDLGKLGPAEIAPVRNDPPGVPDTNRSGLEEVHSRPGRAQDAMAMGRRDLVHIREVHEETSSWPRYAPCIRFRRRRA